MKPPRSRWRRTCDAIERRTGVGAAWRFVADEAIPGGARWGLVFGSVVAFLLAAQLATGFTLALDYSASVDAAHASVSRLADPAQSPGGALLRALHHHGASFVIVALALHVVQVALSGGYRKPREVNWLTGLGLALLVLGLGFTGYLLPWDQTAYYATKVGLNIMRGVPVIGGALADLLQGGPVMGNLTLTRFYAMHVMALPALLFGGVILHLALLRRHGITPPPELAGAPPNEMGAAPHAARRAEPFWPHQAARDAVAIAVVAAVLVFAASRWPPELGAKADPAVPLDARPEWYFFWLFQLLHDFPPPFDWVATLGIPGAILVYLALLPWIDRGRDGTVRSRRWALAGVGAIFGGIAFLTLQVALEESARSETAEVAAGAPAAPPPAIDAARAGVLFGQKCTECHASNGAPDDPDAPDFRDPAFARMGQRQLRKLVKSVQEGGEVMPPFADELTEPEIRGILEHVVLRFAEWNPIPEGTGQGADQSGGAGTSPPPDDGGHEKHGNPQRPDEGEAAVPRHR